MRPPHPPVARAPTPPMDAHLSASSHSSSGLGARYGLGSDAQHLLTPPDAASAPQFEAVVWRRDSADGTWAAARAQDGSTTPLWPGADQYAATDGEVGLLEAKIGSILNRSLPDENVCPDDSPLLPASPPRSGDMLSNAIPPIALPSRAHTIARSEASSAPQEAALTLRENDEEEEEEEEGELRCIPSVDKGKGRATGERPQDLAFFPLPLYPTRTLSTTSLLSTSTSSSIRRARGPPSIPSRSTSHRPAHFGPGPNSNPNPRPESPARQPHAPPARISSLGALARPRTSTSGTSVSARSINSVISDSSEVLPGSRSARSVTFFPPPLAIREGTASTKLASRKRVVVRTKRAQRDTLPLPLERPVPSCPIPEPPRGTSGVHLRPARLGSTLRRSLSLPALGTSGGIASADTMQHPERSKDDMSFYGSTVRSRFSMPAPAPASPESPSTSAKLVKRAPPPPSPGSPFKAHARPSLFSLADMWQDRSRAVAPRGIVHMAEPPAAPIPGLSLSLSSRALARLELRGDFDFVPDILSEVEEADARADRVRAMRAEDLEAVAEAEMWEWPAPPEHVRLSPRVMWERAVRASATVGGDMDAAQEQEGGGGDDADAKRVRDSLRSTTTSASLSSVASTALLTPSASTSACVEDAFRLCVVPPELEADLCAAGADAAGAGPRTPTARHAMLDVQAAGTAVPAKDEYEWDVEEVTPKAPARAVGEKLYVPARRQGVAALASASALTSAQQAKMPLGSDGGSDRHPGRTEPLRVVKKKSSTRGFAGRGFLGAWGESGMAYF